MQALRTIILIFFMLLGTTTALSQTSDNCSVTMSLTIPKYMHITPITSPVLVANITDRTGNLYAPLSTTFRVITNTSETETLYLQAYTTTEGGSEPAMFRQGGVTYIAFANLQKLPTSQALLNCKIGGMPKDSPGVVAYPVTSIIGAKTRYIPAKQKYEVYINNGTTDVSINVGTSVLRSSFSSNDPKGMYQAIVSLTEAGI